MFYYFKHPRRVLFVSIFVTILQLLPVVGLVRTEPTWFEGFCFLYVTFKLTCFLYNVVLDIKDFYLKK